MIQNATNNSDSSKMYLCLDDQIKTRAGKWNSDSSKMYLCLDLMGRCY